MAKTKSTMGLGRLSDPKSFVGAMVPPFVGGAMTAGATLALRAISSPKVRTYTTGDKEGRPMYKEDGTLQYEEVPTDTQLFWMKAAPWIGVAGGGLAALGLYAAFGSSAGVSAFTGAVAVGGALGVSQLLHGPYYPASPTAAIVATPRTGVITATQARMGAVAPRAYVGRTMSRGRLGEVVEEPWASRGYGRTGGGEQLTFGKINTAAYGSSAYALD